MSIIRNAWAQIRAAIDDIAWGIVPGFIATIFSLGWCALFMFLFTNIPMIAAAAVLFVLFAHKFGKAAKAHHDTTTGDGEDGRFTKSTYSR